MYEVVQVWFMGDCTDYEVVFTGSPQEVEEYVAANKPAPECTQHFLVRDAVTKQVVFEKNVPVD